MATKKTATANADTRNNGETVEKVVAIPLRDIDADWTWNARRVARDTEGRVVATANDAQNQEKTTEFGHLRDSIAQDGQKDAVIVRPHPNPAKRAKTPYMLVAGFSRYESLRQLSEDGQIPGAYDPSWVKNPTVKAIVRSLNERMARLENLRENTARSELSGPDLAFGIRRLMSEDPNMSETDIARSLGKNQGYVNQLCKLINGLSSHGNANILDDWRAAPVVIPITAMQAVAKGKDSDAQKAAFEELLRGGKKSEPRGPDAWGARAAKEARLRGHAIGALENRGAISVKDTKMLFTETSIRLLVEFPTSSKKTKKPEDQAAADSKYLEFIRGIMAAFTEGYKLGKAGKMLEAPSGDTAEAPN